MNSSCCAFGAILTLLITTGCYGRHPLDPSETEEAEVARSPSASHITSRCDASGGLHVTAPQNAAVVARDSVDAQIEISIAEPETDTGPSRRTRSLGFVGDAPLTQSRTYGGPWNVPDGLLPIHPHGLASPSPPLRAYSTIQSEYQRRLSWVR